MRVLYYINKYYRRLLKAFTVLTISLLGLAITAFLLLQHPKVQNYVAGKIVQRLSSKLDTKISISGIDVGFYKIKLYDFYMEDQQQDTLLYAQGLSLNYDAFRLFSRDVNIKYLELNQAKVFLKRLKGQENFNYQFIIDAYSSDTKSGNKGGDWDLNLQKALLRNVSFLYLDEPRREKITIALQSTELDMEETDLSNNIIRANEIILKGAQVAHYDLKKPADYIPKAKVITDSDSDSIYVVPVNFFGFDLEANKIILSDARFVHRNENSEIAQQDYFDYDNIVVKNINLTLENVSMTEDSINARMSRFSFFEPKGFLVENLQADVMLSPTKWRFDKLYIKTPNSLIKDQFTFNYSTLTDFYDFLDEVKINTTLDKSRIALQDLQFFAPGIHSTEQFLVSGNISGSVQDLNGKDISFKYGNQTEFYGKFNLFGLPDYEETFIDFTVDELSTTAYEFEEILPFANLPDKAQKLGRVKFKGNFTGFLNDFVAYGDLNTDLGFIKSDINMKLNKGGVAAQYSGNLSTVDFDIGEWLDETDVLGKVTLAVKIQDGQELNIDKLSAKMEGTIARIDFNQYQYSNITFKGDLQKRFFSGQLTSSDKNLDMDFSGTVDFQKNIPRFDLISDIRYADLKAINVTGDEYKLKSKVNFNFEGNNINNIRGTALMADIYLGTASQNYFLDTILLTSEYIDNGKRLKIESELADIMLEGRFNTVDLPAALSNFVTYFYPGFPYKTGPSESYQDFEFLLNIKRDNALTELLIPGLKGMAGTSISGRFDNSSNRIFIDADIPEVTYGQYKAEHLRLSVFTQNDTMFIESDADEIFLSKDLSLPSHSLTARVYDDQVYFNYKASDDTLPNRIDINGILSNNEDSLKLKILNSEIVIADEKWNISKDNQLIFHKGDIYAKNLYMENGDQRLLAYTVYNEKQKTDLHVNMTMVRLGDITNIINYKDYALDGLMTGSIIYSHQTRRGNVFRGDFMVNEFQFNGDTLGMLDFKGNYLPAANRLSLTASLEGKYSQLSVIGDYINSPENERVNFDIDVNRAPFNLLEPFLNGVASGLEGTATGKIKITGKPDDIDMNGELLVKNAAAGVDYLGTRYSVDSIRATFNNNSIFIYNTDMYDKNGNTAQIGGEISFTDFSHFSFEDMYIYTSNNFLFLETTSKDNDLFYGRAYGTGIVLINGPFDDINIYVNAKSDPNTRIFIPINYESGVSQYDFIKFIQHKKDSVVVDNYKTQNLGVTLNMDLDVTTDAEIQLIFDQQAGDIIKGRGEGNINLNVNTYGDFSMYGNYTIKEGQYLFTMQDFINKNFNIEEGGTITWTGDPYDARLNIAAIYRVKASRYELVRDMQSLSDEEKKGLRQPIPVDVHLNLTGLLSAPDITFDIIVPSEASYSFDNAFSRRLIEIKSDEREMNKQVFGLIVLNRFLPSDFSGVYALQSTGVNTVTEFLSNQLSIYFNDWLARYDLELNVQYRTDFYENQGDPTGETTDPIQRLDIRNELELELSKKFGRFAVNVGGNFDFGGNEEVTNTKNVAGDFEIVYSLTEDGNIRVKAFSTSEYDIFDDRNRYKSGIGIFYRKDFNSFKDLFTSDEKKKEGEEKKKEVKEPPKEPPVKEDEKVNTDIEEEVRRPKNFSPAP